MASARSLALVTGASGGIGAAFALLLAEKAYDLVLVARSQSALEEVAEQCRAFGAEADVLALDLTDPASGAAIEERVRGRGKPVQVLINNAGYGLMAPIGARPLAEELGIIDLNVRALAELSHRFLADLRETRGGMINVSSLIAYQPMPYFTLYAASKAFVQTYSRMLAKELAPQGIRVLTLCPGYTETGFQKRAGAEVGMADRFMPKHSPMAVAKIGWQAFERGRTVKIVGIGNALVARLGFLTAPFMGFLSRKAYQMAQAHQAKEGSRESESP